LFVTYYTAPLCLRIESTETLITRILLLQEELDMLLLHYEWQAEVLDMEREILTVEDT
jgi:hypothetical protein